MSFAGRETISLTKRNTKLESKQRKHPRTSPVEKKLPGGERNVEKREGSTKKKNTEKKGFRAKTTLPRGECK